LTAAGAPHGKAQAPAMDAGAEEVEPRWRRPPVLLTEQVEEVGRQGGLGHRWESPDGLFWLRPPAGWLLEQPGPSAPGGEGRAAGELARFVAGAGALSPGAVLRVGYVAGPVAATAEELNTFLSVVVPRWRWEGWSVVPWGPVSLSAGGRRAVVAELELVPGPSASSRDPLVVTYTYISLGDHPGILLQARVPRAHHPALRVVLRAVLASVGFPGEVPTPPFRPRGPPWWLGIPVLLALLLMGAATLLRRRGGEPPAGDPW
jgi:hypothetical protein